MPTLGDIHKTDTAADHLTVKKRDASKPDTDLGNFSRVPVSNEEWNVGVDGTTTYKVRFDNNFAKKHLFTFTKKTGRVDAKTASLTTAATAAATEAAPAKSADALREDANMFYLMEKIKKNLNNRAQTTTCVCGHERGAHFTKSGYDAPDGCKGCLKDGYTWRNSCKYFDTAYGMHRDAKLGASSFDPLAGAPTKINGCIVMNKIPKADFNKALIAGIKNSIPYTGHLSQPGQKLIKLDFGPARKGAIIKIDGSVSMANPVTTEFQGCYVIGRSEATMLANTKIWTIFHMETDTSGHGAF